MGFPHFRLFEIYFEKTKEVRFPLFLIVFRLDVVRLARRYCANGAGSVRAHAALRFENDRSRTRSDFDFVNKMLIFSPKLSYRRFFTNLVATRSRASPPNAMSVI